MRVRLRTASFRRACRLGAVACVLVAASAVAQTAATLRPRSAVRPSLLLTPGRDFAPSSYVHRAIDPRATRDARSAVWVADLVRQVADSGVASVNINQYTPPLYVVGAGTPRVAVRAARSGDVGWRFEPLERQWTHVPLPAGFEPSAGSDREAVVYQPEDGRYWEFWGLERTGRRVVDSSGRSVDEWQAAWGGLITDLGTNPGYFETTREGFKFGTAATGLALLGGLLTIAEQRNGVIPHAVHVALPRTRAGAWASPAQRSDGAVERDDAIPQGATFTFPRDLDLARIDMDPYARMIARAVQTYGMVVRDTAGSVVFYAENPLVAPGGVDPYFGPNGILRCPGGRIEASCYPDSNNRLAGFPWERLVALEAEIKS